MPSWAFKLEWEVFDGVKIIPAGHVDMKEIILDPYRRIYCAIVRFDVHEFETLGDFMIYYFICEAKWVCGASVLGYITTQLKRALSTVFGPVGVAVSGATVVVAHRGAPTRSIDRS